MQAAGLRRLRLRGCHAGQRHKAGGRRQAGQLLRDPVRIEVEGSDAPVPAIVQRAIQVDAARRTALLKHLGFVVEGYARDFVKVNGLWRDNVLLSLVADGAD